MEKEITAEEQLPYEAPRSEDYEAPRIEDYGTLVDLTAAKDFTGSDWTYFLGNVS